MVEGKIEVRITRIKLELCKVEFPGGHHIVVGGRLVSERNGEKVVPHRDLPEYTHGMFPGGDFGMWDTGDTDVTVTVVSSSGRRRAISEVRASVMLFTAFDKDEVRDWIMKGGSSGNHR